MPKKVGKISEPHGLAAARRARPPVVRMVKIHDALSAGRLPNCRSLAEEFEVSTKTLQRDIEFMRDQLNLPIAYDAVRHGYYYEGAVGQFPMVTVSEGELVALLVAQKAVEQYKGTSFERPLQAAFEKLVSSLDGEASISLHELSEAVSFRSAGVPHGQVENFEVLADAIMHRRVIEFDYRSMTADKSERRVVEPYHLPCINNQWYLIGRDRGRRGMRTFALPRVSGARVGEGTFEKPASFSVAKMLSGSFSAFEAGKTERLRLAFSPAVARLVNERQWHKSQKVKPLDGGALELTMQVGLAPDLFAWILGWGGEVEVLEPASLRERVAETGRRMTDKNSHPFA